MTLNLKAFKYSKEFQAKIKSEFVPNDDECIKTLTNVLEDIEDHHDVRFKFRKSTGRRWKRKGIRYDTDCGLFKASNVTLATEMSTINGEHRTKLKCKLHNFVPELHYDTLDSAYCCPTQEYQEDTKIKVEQDIHFNSNKFCTTGYLFIPGIQNSFKTVGDFLRYYKNIDKLRGVKASMPVTLVKHWDESVFDDMEMSVNAWEMFGALVIRRHPVTDGLVEAEFSIKVSRPGESWNHTDLSELSKVYNLLYSSGLFDENPEVFQFSEPT